MRNLIRFIDRYATILWFILLQFFSFWLINNYTYFQQSKIFQKSQKLTSLVEGRKDQFMQYLHLTEANQELMDQITDNNNKSNDAFVSLSRSLVTKNDTIYRRKFYYYAAKSINSSYVQIENSVTLNKGRANGIKPDMAVINAHGLVGKTASVSEHFCLVLPVINPRAAFSVKVKGQQYFGVLKWTGEDYRYASVKEMAKHAQIQPGDTVETRESLFLPEGILVGRVVKAQPIEGSNFLDISLELFVDFSRLYHVQVVENLMREEQQNLEKSLNHD